MRLRRLQVFILCLGTLAWRPNAWGAEIESLQPERPLLLKRVAIADVLREGFVLPATGEVSFALPEERDFDGLVFECGLGGRWAKDLPPVPLTVKGSKGETLAVIPLSASAESFHRNWTRVRVPWKPHLSEGTVRFQMEGLEEIPGATPVLSYPRLVHREAIQKKRPNLAIIVCDTLRRDYMSLYRSKGVKTPALDEWGNRSVVFDHAITGIPITQPAHFSLLTGLYPIQSGLVNNSMIPPSGFPTLATVLKGYGYRTGVIASVYALKEEWGLGPGFDEFIDANEVPRERMPESMRAWLNQDSGDPFFLLLNFDHPHSPRVPPKGTPLFRILFAGGGQRDLAVTDYELKEVPVFLSPGENRFVFEALPDHTLPDPLKGYDQRSYDLGYAGAREIKVANENREFELRYGPEWSGKIFEETASLVVLNPLRDAVFATLSFHAYRVMGEQVHNERYRRSVEEADRYFGRVMRVLEETGHIEDTIVIFTADHGEGLYQNGVGGHIQGVFSQQVRIPLFVHAACLAPKRTDYRAHLVDLFPTLVEWLELDVPGTFPGRSFLQVLREPGEDNPDRWLFSASYPPMSHVLRYGLRNSQWSYVRDRKKESLFAIGSQGTDWEDIEEVSAQNPEALKTMRENLDRFIDRLGEPGKGAASANLSEEEMEKMRALGYLR